MMNAWCGMGRMVDDPVLGHTNSGGAVVNFTIGIDRDHRDTEGKKATDFIDVSAYGKEAEFLAENFRRGDVVGILGRIETRQWTAEDGGKRRAVNIKAERIYFGGKRRE